MDGNNRFKENSFGDVDLRRYGQAIIRIGKSETLRISQRSNSFFYEP